MRVDAGQGREWWLPNPSSLSRGRAKLGPGVHRYLFEQVKGLLGADEAPGVFCCGLRIVSMDGSVTDVPDSQENDAFFGRPSNQSRDGAFAQVGWVVAAESGTGSLLGAAIGRYRTAEQPLARDLLRQECFRPGMLVLTDPVPPGPWPATSSRETGAHILWRASASFALKPVKVLHDGTYLAELERPGRATARRRSASSSTRCTPRPQQAARRGTSEVFALVTSLLDVEEYPALDLAFCYPRRWGCETVIGHHKTDMGEGQPVLQSTAGVLQEMWALFAVYQAICRVVGIAVNASRHPAGADELPSCPGRREGLRGGFFPLTSH